MAISVDIPSRIYDNSLRDLSAIAGHHFDQISSAATLRLLPSNFIFLDGTLHRQRFLILWFGSPVWMPACSFRLFFLLNLATYLHHHHLPLPLDVFPDPIELPWLNIELLDPSGNATRYIYRLSKDLHTQGITSNTVLNNREGFYRSIINADTLLFNFPVLSHYPDVAISGPSRKMCRLLKLPLTPVAIDDANPEKA